MPLMPIHPPVPLEHEDEDDEFDPDEEAPAPKKKADPFLDELKKFAEEMDPPQWEVNNPILWGKPKADPIYSYKGKSTKELTPQEKLLMNMHAHGWVFAYHNGMKIRITNENVEKIQKWATCRTCNMPLLNDSPNAVDIIHLGTGVIGCIRKETCLKCAKHTIFNNINQRGEKVSIGMNRFARKWEVGSGRTVGIEIECNPSILSLVRVAKDPFCEVKGDQSLRGRGIEFVSPILRESNVDDWLDRFHENVHGTVYSRCGMHIWLGALDLSWFDVWRLWKYCKMWERDFFSMVSKSRRPMAKDDKSGRPLGLPGPSLYRIKNKENLLSVLYGSNGKCASLRSEHGMPQSRMQTNKRANDKGYMYNGGIIHRGWWINLHGYFYRRAIEIRLHQGTTNVRKISMWVRLWSDVLDHISRGGSLGIPPLAVTSPLVRMYYNERIRALASI